MHTGVVYMKAAYITTTVMENYIITLTGINAINKVYVKATKILVGIYL